MPEEQFGQAGLEQQAGFVPMEPPASEPAESKDFGSDASSLRDAARELDRGRSAEERPVDEIAYRRQGDDGKVEREFESKTVKMDRAAKDLAEFRQRRARQEEQEINEAIRRDTDALKRGEIPARQSQQPQQPQTSQNVQFGQDAQSYLPHQQAVQAAERARQQQDEALTANARDPGVNNYIKQNQTALGQRLVQLDKEIAEASAVGKDTTAATWEYQALHQQLEGFDFQERVNMGIQMGMSPKVASMVADKDCLSFITAATDGVKNEYRAELQNQSDLAKNVVNIAAQVFISSFPELLNCKTQNEIQIALDSIRRANPDRARVIEGHIHNFNNAVIHGAEMQHQVTRAKYEQFLAYQANHANVFRAQNKEFMSPTAQKQVAEGVMQYLIGKGMHRDEVIRLHDGLDDGSLLFNHHVTQSVLWDAYRYHMSKTNIPHKKAPADPVRTLRPGNAETHLEPRVERLPNELSAREAAQILSNRRSRARRPSLFAGPRCDVHTGWGDRCTHGDEHPRPKPRAA
jgi:hypothetical protein